MILNDVEERAAVVCFAKDLVLIRLRVGRRCAQRKLLFVQYREVSAPFDAVEKNIGCICLKCCTTKEMNLLKCPSTITVVLAVKSLNMSFQRFANCMELKFYRLY